MKVYLFVIINLFFAACKVPRYLNQSDTKPQEQFLLACKSQNVPELRKLISFYGPSIDVNKPLSDFSKENCLLFLTKAANFEGISLLLENGANPYYKNKNESALLIA